MIAQMDRVEIVFLRSELDAMAPFLQEQGVLHLEDVPLTVEDHPGYLHRVHLPEDAKKDLDTFEHLATLLREAAPLLPAAPAHASVMSAGRVLAGAGDAEIKRQVTSWHRNLRSFARRRLNIQDNVEVLGNYGRVLQAIAPLLDAEGVKLGVTARAMVLESYGAEELDVLETRLQEGIGADYKLLLRPMGRDTQVAVVTHPAGEGETLTKVLEQAGIAGVRPPDKEIEDPSISAVIGKVNQKISTLKKEAEALGEELHAYAQTHGPALTAAQRLVGDRIAQLRVNDHFAQSELMGVVQGWAPSVGYADLETALAKRFGGRAAMARLPQEDVENTTVPTLLKNHPLLKPFQIILSIFNPPSYGTMDPTLLVAVSFILFYGFILGDVGYGLFIIVVAAWAKKKWGHHAMVGDAMTIAKWMGASAMVWGVVFGEFFGNLPELYFGLEHPPLHRSHDPILLLGIAFGYGMVHIPLSLLLGIREGYRHGHKAHAEEKLGMLLGLAGVGAMVLSLAGYFPAGTALGAAVAAVLFAASLFYLVRGMGGMFAIGIIELVGLTSNVLSYGRLMALGMASVALADLANMLLSLPGAWMIFIGIPGAALIHLMNIGIGVFSPTIHSLRLNYVEFLPKFYEPEGRNYQPFRKELAQWI